MNILPKKSWHVRTKKNIERVRRDEAEAERLARIEQNKQLEVEQEARVRELRLRAGLEESEQPKGGHINLFAGFQDRKQESNREHEEEKRDEESKWLQRAGVSNKLGKPQDANKPWYCIDQPGTSRLLQHPSCLPSVSSVRGPNTNTGSCLEILDTSSDPKEEVKTQTDKRIARSNLITSIYDPLTAIKDAERIVREKRAQKREQERLRQIEENRKHLTQLHDYDYYKLTRPPQLPMVPVLARRLAPALRAASERLPDDSKSAQGFQEAPIAKSGSSSPEIIKIVRGKDRETKRKKSKKEKKRKKEKDSRRPKRPKHHKHDRHKSGDNSKN